jgi:hypothetical protein
MELWTNSRARLARTCLRKHKLRYVDGWILQHAPEALRFGTLIHKGLEAYWLEEDPVAAIGGLGVDDLEQVRAEEWLHAYVERWKTDREQWETVSVEKQWEVPLPNPDTRGVSKTWKLAGKLDVFARRVVDCEYNPAMRAGTSWVIEHKTTSYDVSNDASDYWAKLLMDTQVSQYEIGCIALGLDLSGTVYDVGRKAGLKLKKRVKNIRQRKSESAAEFEARCLAEAPPESLDQFRARLREHYQAKLGLYFIRKPVPRTRMDLREYLRDAWAHSSMIRDCMRLGIAPKNPEACNAYGLCEYFEHCAFGAALEDDPRFVKSEWVHPELEKVPV